MALLEVDDIRTYYGSIEALKGITIQVEQGEIVTLIGSNGAGKSTTLRSISGLTPPRFGAIRFEGRDISKMPAQEIVALGISQSPEGRRTFQRMTVRENLELGAYRRGGARLARNFERSCAIFPRLRERLGQLAGTLSGGEQQMLAMGRALMLRPEILLLDEPSMGLAPKLVEEVFRIIRLLKAEQVTMLLVEQFAMAALGVADHAYVLENGRIRFQGPAQQMRNDPAVRAAYLGGSH